MITFEPHRHIGHKESTHIDIVFYVSTYVSMFLCGSKKHFPTFLIFLIAQSVSAQTVSKVWVADNGDGSYKNPVIHADYSDPDAIRVGDDYYMVSSSFTHIPGLPVLHSKDLVNWKLIGHALKKQPPFHWLQVYDPSISFFILEM